MSPLDTRLKINAQDKAQELHELSTKFSLSHSVLATAERIEEIARKEKLKDSSIDEKNDKELFEKYKNNKIKTNQDIKKLEPADKVYISVIYLRHSDFNSSVARTYRYVRTYKYNEKNVTERPESVSNMPSESEHFEILLPPFNPDNVVSYDEHGRISNKCVRYLVGHELAHLWLHLNTIRESTYTKLNGANFTEVQEQEANAFSYKLAELRSEHLKTVNKKTP